MIGCVEFLFLGHMLHAKNNIKGYFSTQSTQHYSVEKFEIYFELDTDLSCIVMYICMGIRIFHSQFTTTRHTKLNWTTLGNTIRFLSRKHAFLRYMMASLYDKSNGEVAFFSLVPKFIDSEKQLRYVAGIWWQLNGPSAMMEIRGTLIYCHNATKGLVREKASTLAIEVQQPSQYLLFSTLKLKSNHQYFLNYDSVAAKARFVFVEHPLEFSEHEYEYSASQIRIFATALGLSLFAANSSTESHSPRIINGSEAALENTKFQVSIRLKRYDRNFGDGHICGGALVGPNKVLTAAHCFYNVERKRYRKANEFVVVMGTLNRYRRVNGTIVSFVTSIAYMSTFSMDTMHDDIGVMFLKTGLPINRTHLTIAPIALANTSTPAGVTCQVSGWGKTELGTLSSTLRAANVTTISKTVCSILYNSGLANGMLCAGYIYGGTDSCQGDSGGPLVYNNTLIGIVSWGSGCAQPGFPGIYADVHYYNKWIMERNAANLKTTIGSSLMMTTLFLIMCNCRSLIT